MALLCISRERRAPSRSVLRQRLLSELVKSPSRYVLFEPLIPLIVESLLDAFSKAQKILAGQIRNRLFNLLNGTHGTSIPWPNQFSSALKTPNNDSTAGSPPDKAGRN